MERQDIDRVFRILQEEAKKWQDETVGKVARDPFFVLLGGILSHRTKDTTTHRVLLRLRPIIRRPEDLLLLSEAELARLIYPVGFYREKAKRLREIARILLERYEGKIPETEEDLLALPGVGRKTANLVLSLAFGKPAICVDTHVHRITNRLGLVATKTPEETERALQEILPKDLWGKVNTLLVLFGQNVCLPRNPRCTTCPIAAFCERRGLPGETQGDNLTRAKGRRNTEHAGS